MIENSTTPQSTVEKIAFSKGLTSEQARSLLEKFGPNTMPDTVLHPLQRALDKFWTPVPWLLEAAFLLETGNSYVRQRSEPVCNSRTATHLEFSPKSMGDFVICRRCHHHFYFGFTGYCNERFAFIYSWRNIRGGSGLCISPRFCQSPPVQSTRDCLGPRIDSQGIKLRLGDCFGNRKSRCFIDPCFQRKIYLR